MTTYKERTDAPARRLTLAEILEIFAAGQVPLKFAAYDGSTAGPEDAQIGLDLRTPRGTTYLATAPGELGLARAYVSGDVEPHGVHPGVDIQGLAGHAGAAGADKKGDTGADLFQRHQAAQGRLGLG